MIRIVFLLCFSLLSAAVHAIGTPSYVSAWISNTGTEASISWSTVSGADYYQLQYRNGTGSWGTSGGMYYGGSHSWSNVTETLLNRNYRMRACDSSNNCSSWSSSSNWISTPPPPPPIPSTPPYVSASINSDGTSAWISWGTVSHADYYQLQYRDGNGSWNTSGMTYTGGSYTWSNVTEKLIDRNYRMNACNSSGCSSWSSSSNWISTPVSVPAFVSASVNSTSASITWGTVPEANYYELQYRDGTGSWGTSQGSYHGGSHVWNNPKEMLKNRNYRMRACVDATYCSSWSSASNSINTPKPITPSAPEANIVGEGIALTWSDVAWATRYEITQKWRSGMFEDIKKHETTANYKSWEKLYDGTYNHSLVACNDMGCSEPLVFHEVALRTEIFPPTSVNVAISGKDATITWTEMSGASYYQLQYRDGEGAWQTSNLKYTGHAHTWENFQSIFKDRRYRMRSCDDKDVCSEGWTTSAETISTPKPLAPNKPEATVSKKDIHIKWDKVDYATYYLINEYYSNGMLSSSNREYKSDKPEYEKLDQSSGTYKFRVKACNIIECSDDYSVYSAEVEVLSDAHTPSAPVAKVTGTKVGVEWNKSYNAQYYDLSIKFDSNDWTKEGRFVYQDKDYSGDKVVISWDDVDPGARSYKVKACIEPGWCSEYSPASNVIKNFVAAPKASLVENHGVAVNWDTSIQGKFDIQIKYNGNDWTVPGRYTSNDKHISWPDLPSGHRSYKVRSCNSDLSKCTEWSAESNKVEIPVWIHNVIVNGSTTTLEWGPVPGTEYYDISIKYNENDWTLPGRYTSPGGNESGTNRITWENLDGGVRSYKIRSCISSTECSAWSSATEEYKTAGLPADTPKLKVSAPALAFINTTEQITWEFESPATLPLNATLYVMLPNTTEKIKLASSSNGSAKPFTKAPGKHQYLFEEAGVYRFFAQACGLTDAQQIIPVIMGDLFIPIATQSAEDVEACSELWETEQRVEVIDQEFTAKNKGTELTWPSVPGVTRVVIESASCADASDCDFASLDWDELATLTNGETSFGLSNSAGKVYRIKVC
ncbi:hypothetical protein HG263_21980, partial [Pseudoalteromonas sp. JBTF-M23]